MRFLLTITMLAAAISSGACSDTRATSTANTAQPSGNVKPNVTASSPSETVKSIYHHAIKRDCASIPPMLTEEFKKAVGSSKDSLEALCDTFTDSSKLSSFEIAGEEIKGDSATVKVKHTFRDGKTETKDERMKKVGDKWLMDS